MMSEPVDSLIRSTTFRSSLSFDGLFMDENEPSTESNGAVGGCSTTDPYDKSVYKLSEYHSFTPFPLKERGA